MKLNKEKLDQMVEEIKSESFKEDGFYGITEEDLRTALTPLCMEMTDEEIEIECDKQSALITDADESIGWDNAFMMGANFVRYGK